MQERSLSSLKVDLKTMEKALETMQAELGTEMHSQLSPSEQQEVSSTNAHTCPTHTLKSLHTHTHTHTLPSPHIHTLPVAGGAAAIAQVSGKAAGRVCNEEN